MNAPENAYSSPSYYSDLPKLKRDAYLDTVSRRRRNGGAAYRGAAGSQRRERQDCHQRPRRRTAAPASKAGVVFRPRTARGCASPALSTYGHRSSLLEKCLAVLAAMAKLALVLALIGAAIVGARMVTHAISREAAASQVEANAPSLAQASTEPLDEGQRASLISSLQANPADYAARVPLVLQGDAYPSDCEPAALASTLQSMGVSASLEDVIAFLDIDPAFVDFVYHYAGDPAGDGSAWPQAMVDTATRYLESAQSEVSLTPINISGASFADLRAITDAGYPVMVWTTTSMEDPEFSDYEILGYQFVVNNHCVVMTGMSEDGGHVSVMDSLEGMMERDADTFARIYEERSCLAMMLVPNDLLA